MKKLPLWKIRREVARPLGQLRTLAADLGTYFFGARYYDVCLSKKRRKHLGQVPFGPKAAVFVIYPNYGVTGSYFATLDWFRERDYSVTVVSNLPLGESDRIELLARSSKVIERPNFGYDFGAYREGILSFGEAIKTLERLVLINDSVWFPLPGSRDWLEDVKAMDVDFAGAVSNYGMPRIDADDFRNVGSHYRSDHPNFHYCSFALSLSNRVLKDPSFHRFWKKLPLTSSKKRTVRRGEIGFTKWAIRHGFTHGETLNVATIPESLNTLDRDSLIDACRHLLYPEHERLSELRSDLLADPGSSEQEYKALFVTTVARVGAAYSTPFFNVMRRGWPFLKKSPLWLGKEASDVTLSLTSILQGPLGRQIHEEASSIREKLDSANARTDLNEQT